MSYYACSCDAEMPEFHGASVRTARKPHKCYECSCPIQPGEKYEYTFGKWEGDISIFKTCLHCVELRDWAKISVPCFCWVYGDIHENIRDLVSEACKDMPSGWVFEWGRRMVRIRRRQREFKVGPYRERKVA